VTLGRPPSWLSWRTAGTAVSCPPKYLSYSTVSTCSIAVLGTKASLDRSPPIATVKGGDFLGSSSAPTSPPAIRVISHPPVAAPAAGGWGITGSRCVYSVGSSRVLAGGAAEVEAWPEWLLKTAVLSSGVGAPVLGFIHVC
jgi:hypothetical protein